MSLGYHARSTPPGIQVSAWLYSGLGEDLNDMGVIAAAMNANNFLHSAKVHCVGPNEDNGELVF
jgi:hypothetical protein